MQLEADKHDLKHLRIFLYLLLFSLNDLTDNQ